MPGDRLQLSAFLLATAAAMGLCAPAPAAASAGLGAAGQQSACSRFAAPNGSDGGHGSASRPFQTPQRLANSLRAGQTGCLLAGTYNGDLRFPRGGYAGAPITLTSAPGQSATIVGRIWIPKGSNYVRLTNLILDGRNVDGLPSPSVNSAYAQFVGDDVSNEHTGICFELGSDGGYGQAVGTLIQNDRIHDCGVLPATNHNHGIYVANSVGARIIGNLIYGNADRGIQLYWNAQRTLIAGNIIDRNGDGIDISGDSGFASSNNTIVNNIITNSLVRSDVESWWPSGNPVGVGNLVAGNCIHGGQGTIDFSGGGFVARDNFNVDPRYANAAAGDYTLLSGSPCAAVLSAAGSATVQTYGVPNGVWANARHHVLAWLRVNLRRRRRSDVLSVAGRIACGAGSRRTRVIVAARLRGRWRRVATVTPGRCGFRLARRVRPAQRQVEVRVHAYARGAVDSSVVIVTAGSR